MRLFSFNVALILLFAASSVLPATINGRFTVLNISSWDCTVILQVNTDTGTDDLGGATIVFGFDTTAITFPENPLKNVDYAFHNFCGGNYSSATVTRPMKNTIWVNIDLPYVNNNNGTVVSGNPEWTDVVTIHFYIVDPGKTPNLVWLTNSLFWGIYDADNSTLWENGVFEDYPTSIEPTPDLPKDYSLEQNYPNPFNPTTKIRYSIPSVTLGGVERSVPVTLKVFDILGNEVATLVNEEKAPGIYEVEFSSHNGISNLSSGIYIYRIESAGFVDAKKMILLK